MKTKKNAYVKFMVAIACSILVIACSDDNDNPIETPQEVLYGKEISVGKGIVKSFVKKNQQGDPESYGISFSEGALEGLPHEGASYIVPMPDAHGTLINHVSFDYATHHHAPVYDTEHITAHFYYISEAEKNAITTTGPEIDLLPPAEFHPKDYIPTPGGADKMGKHWPDTTAEELHGKPFKRSLIYGSYNGKFIFMEPLIEMNFLKSKPAAEWPVKEQRKVQTTGFYPASYALSFDQNTKLYSLTFNDLKRKTN